MPLLHIVVWNPKFSETIKRAPSKFFSWIQRVFNIFCDTHVWIIELFASGTWVAPQLSSNTKTFRNIKRTPSLLLRYRDIKTKKLDKLWWHPAKIYGNFCARETKNVNFNVFSAFVCFRPIFWREGKAHFFFAHSFFSEICECHANIVCRLISIWYITYMRCLRKKMVPTWKAPTFYKLVICFSKLSHSFVFLCSKLKFFLISSKMKRMNLLPILQQMPQNWTL